jgi:hypothetical protein
MQRPTSRCSAAHRADSSLRDYLEYISESDPRASQAIAGARRVKSRQTDAIALLNEGKIGALAELWRLDISATPELCVAFA